MTVEDTTRHTAKELNMAKRRLKKPPKASTDAPKRLRTALAKCTKDELIDILVEFANEDRNVLRRLDARFELEAPPKELVAATRRAIADATDFDERDINRNFSYDYEAYSEVKRNLSRLIELGQLRPAMELSLELMKARKLPGRNERRGIDDRRHRRVSARGHPSPQEVRPAARRRDRVVRGDAQDATVWDSSAPGNFGSCDNTSTRHSPKRTAAGLRMPTAAGQPMSAAFAGKRSSSLSPRGCPAIADRDRPASQTAAHTPRASSSRGPPADQ